MAAKSPLDNVINLAKRRGFVFQAGEIYGGSRSAWDYGPLGVELKENIKAEWWKTFVRSREDMVGLDSSIILPRAVWEASGHVETFTDPLVECTQCHRRHRQDHLLEAFEAKKGRPAEGMAEIVCPDCGTKGAWTEPQLFSGLVKTYLGPVDNEEGLHYMRPETAQGIFVNFLNVLGAARKKPPFGIGQIGKAFRNEITPGNFIFRTREFEQMEIEYFVPPAEAGQHFDRWVEDCWDWFIDLGIDPAHLRKFDVPADERAHYSDATIDLEYDFGFTGGDGWGELMGIANRTDYDLKGKDVVVVGRGVFKLRLFMRDAKTGCASVGLAPITMTTTPMQIGTTADVMSIRFMARCSSTVAAHRTAASRKTNPQCHHPTVAMTAPARMTPEAIAAGRSRPARPADRPASPAVARPDAHLPPR